MRVHHLALRTRDLARLAAFYQGVLSFSKLPGERDETRSVWLAAGETILMLERADEEEPLVPAGSKELVAFAIDAGDMERWRRALAAHGVAIEAATAYTLYVRDPDGRRVGLSAYER